MLIWCVLLVFIFGNLCNSSELYGDSFLQITPPRFLFKGYAYWESNQYQNYDQQNKIMDESCENKYPETVAATLNQIIDGGIIGLPEDNDSGSAVFGKCYQEECWGMSKKSASNYGHLCVLPSHIGSTKSYLSSVSTPASTLNKKIRSIPHHTVSSTDYRISNSFNNIEKEGGHRKLLPSFHLLQNFHPLKIQSHSSALILYPILEKYHHYHILYPLSKSSSFHHLPSSQSSSFNLPPPHHHLSNCPIKCPSSHYCFLNTCYPRRWPKAYSEFYKHCWANAIRSSICIKRIQPIHKTELNWDLMPTFVKVPTSTPHNKFSMTLQFLNVTEKKLEATLPAMLQVVQRKLTNEKIDAKPSQFRFVLASKIKNFRRQFSSKQNSDQELETVTLVISISDIPLNEPISLVNTLQGFTEEIRSQEPSIFNDDVNMIITDMDCKIENPPSVDGDENCASNYWCMDSGECVSKTSKCPCRGFPSSRGDSSHLRQKRAESQTKTDGSVKISPTLPPTLPPTSPPTKILKMFTPPPTGLVRMVNPANFNLDGEGTLLSDSDGNEGCPLNTHWCKTQCISDDVPCMT